MLKSSFACVLRAMRNKRNITQKNLAFFCSLLRFPSSFVPRLLVMPIRKTVDKARDFSAEFA